MGDYTSGLRRTWIESDIVLASSEIPRSSRDSAGCLDGEASSADDDYGGKFKIRPEPGPLVDEQILT